MSIVCRSAMEIEKLARVNALVALVLKELAEAVKPGVTTKQLEELSPGLKLPRQGVLAGKARFAGTFKRLKLAQTDVTFEAYKRGRTARHSPEALKDNVRQAILKMGIASNDDILFLHHKRLPWGNVIFDVGMEENRQVVRDHLAACEVKSCGRFGEWDYLWSNQSFLSGYQAL